MKKNGGSVFPTLQAETGDYGTILYAMQNPGLTIRDYYRGMALAGLLANPSLDVCREKFKTFVTQADIIADIVLEERE